MDVNRHWLSYYRLRLISIFALAFGLTGAFAAVQKSAEIGDLRIAEMLGEGGEYSDFFVTLKEHPEFARLSEKHGLDDPAAWATLRRRFVLNHAELQGNLVEAESMMKAKDQRSGLDGKVISAEATRERGRARYEQLVGQMDELKQLLRLIDEMEAVLEQVPALTGKIRFQNKSRQSFTAKLLFIDGQDLIIKRGQDAYFRVPAATINHRTKLKIMNEVVSGWQELPEIRLDRYAEEDEAREELLAYDDFRLYIKDPGQGNFSEARPEIETRFTPYAQQLESAREALASAERDKKAILQTKLDTLEKADALNQSRLKTIQWYEARLDTQVPNGI